MYYIFTKMVQFMSSEHDFAQLATQLVYYMWLYHREYNKVVVFMVIPRPGM